MAWLISKALLQAYENSHCSQALAVESLAANCSDGELSAPLNGNLTQQAYLSPVKTTDAWSRFPSGITLSPLTESRGQDVLTWFLEGFPAKTLAQPEKAQASPESDQACGTTWRGSLAKYDPASLSWRTAQCLLLGGLEQFSETWPRWGLMRDGECWGLTPSAGLMDGHESGLSLPTPLKSDERKFMKFKKASVLKSTFGCHVNSIPYWTTANRGVIPSVDLITWVMNWPIGWTSLQPLGMAKSLKWLQRHGEC